MQLYEYAMMKVVDKINFIKKRLEEVYQYPVIENIEYRVKNQESIIKKMEKKGVNRDYISLVNSIEDIAGVRVICPLEEDIQLMRAIICELPNVNIIEVKDYITHPKKSGYSAYHMIVEIPINIKDNFTYIKIEIQMCTSAMNFWSKMEHEIRYKGKEEISKIDSRKLTWYVKVLDLVQSRIVKIYRKHEIKQYSI